MSMVLRFLRSTLADNAAKAPHLPSSQTFVRAKLEVFWLQQLLLGNLGVWTPDFLLLPSAGCFGGLL